MICCHYVIPINCIVPPWISSADILNCISSIAEVVLKYPAKNVLYVVAVCCAWLALPKKCLTKVVELGLNNLKYPDTDWSLSLPKFPIIVWKPVPCAKSALVLYCTPWSVPASLWNAWKVVDVIASL